VDPVFVGPGGSFPEMAREWRRVAPRMGELQRLPNADQGQVRAVRALVRDLQRAADEFLTVMVPERVRGRSILRLVLPGSPFWLKLALLFEPGVVTCNVTLPPEEFEPPSRTVELGRPVEPARTVVLIPVASVHDATERAATYAKLLRPSFIEGIFFASEDDEWRTVAEEWVARKLNLRLAIVDAPFRDITGPLLREIRKYTARGDTTVTVVLPEFVVRRWWQHLLHGQTGLFIKRLLFFEPHVVVTSVPYRL
jgi:hypothetical protein